MRGYTAYNPQHQQQLMILCCCIADDSTDMVTSSHDPSEEDNDDVEVMRLSRQLDGWYRELKSNVLVSSL